MALGAAGSAMAEGLFGRAAGARVGARAPSRARPSSQSARRRSRRFSGAVEPQRRLACLPPPLRLDLVLGATLHGGVDGGL
eukprot:8783094-Pyramimonas_sp.AAC.1